MLRSQKKPSTTGKSASVLIPVDFSPKGELAVSVGFELARRLSKPVVLIHASVLAGPEIVPQFPDDFNGLDNESSELEEIELEQEIHEIDEKMMGELKTKLLKQQQDGQLPQIPFDTVLSPGMPEDVISEYCEVSPVEVVVMATRGREKRREELMGSVTAEVIDHRPAPVFTVPEDYSFAGFKEIVRICAFCLFDEGDFDAIAKMMDMFGNPEVKIYLFPASDKIKGEEREEVLKNLATRLKTAFPNSDFFVGEGEDKSNLRTEAETFFLKESIQMIVAPNRKRNAISRFFNPSLAHKILYEIDFPMLAIPV
ncbi:MAG: universal stress protein [Muribaculaceae bacterium]|nr:universal stress protein [Muribaculaceae bacterium]